MNPPKMNSPRISPQISPQNSPKRMLIENMAWAQERAQNDPSFFAALARGQSPKVLWIGCSDSRVPVEIITNSHPGDIFVHRNIANMFCPSDDNVSSVLEYAVNVLQVPDIIVCGHYGCGGVKAALFPVSEELPYVRRRIAPLCALARRQHAELDSIAPGDERINRLAELNVLEQVRALRATPIVRNAPQKPAVHGWIFGLHDGRVRVLTHDGDASDRTHASAEALLAAGR
jgi:carbonic anhydrase